MDLPKRKTVRLQKYNYNTPGYYFITICTKKKQKLLCSIVGTGVLDGPIICYTERGKTANKHLQVMSDFYEDIKVDKYVIMPNHIHLLIHILDHQSEPPQSTTPANTKIARFVSAFKRFCNREYGENIWQARSHDHVIRGEKDYLKIWEYIDNNPAKWTDDCFYVE